MLTCEIAGIIRGKEKEPVPPTKAGQVMVAMQSRGLAVQSGQKWHRPNLFKDYLVKRWANPVTDKHTPSYC